MAQPPANLPWQTSGRGQQGGGSESHGSETALVTVRPANGIRAGGRKTSLVTHTAFKIHISFGLLLPLPLVKYCLPDKGSGCYPNLYCLLVLRKRFKFVRQLGWGISLNFSVSYLVKKKKIILVTKPSHGLGQELPVTFSNVSSAAGPITVLLANACHILETTTSWLSSGSYEELRLYNKRRKAECEIYGY